MEDLSDKRLNEEFDRVSKLRDECEVSMYEIRREKARRKQADIDKLQDEIDALS